MEKLFKKKHLKLMNVFLALFMIFSCVVPVHATTEPRTIKGTLKVDTSVGWKLAGTSWW